MVELEWSPPEEFEEYRLVRALGRGSTGQVYLAHDSLLDRLVAVKFLQGADPRTRTRLFEEARAIARLHHPNVVAIYRVAEASGHPYLVSEYVRGRTLDQLDRPVPSRQVLALALDLCRGLAAAHRCGVLHRDVKPANAMVSDDGRAKLLDFGLAVVIDDRSADPGVVPPRERAGGASELPPGLAGTTASLGPRPAPAPAPTAKLVVRRAAIAAVTVQLAPALLAPTSHVPLTSSPGGYSHLEGTPLYMAPELWRGEPATRRSDLYSLGILLYELLAGAAPFRGVAMAELGDAVESCDIPRLGDRAPGVEPALAAIVDRLVERDPGGRFPSAEALLVALEELATPPSTDAVPDGNPYRGLAPFGSAHGAVFFGRRGEVRELVDRVRSEALVIVGGDSGTGKSSLCRAGVLPWLAEHDGWSCVDVVPGRHPVRALAAVLAAWAGADEVMLATALRDAPEAFARAIRRDIVDRERNASRSSGAPGHHPPCRLLVFVDQLEELLTVAKPDEARVVAAALAALGVRTPSVRVLATCRSDFLSRLAALPGLGEEMRRALYFLRPLAGDRIREVIVRPAAAKGVTFESEALVDTLVEQTEQAPGGLPLLQFTLAELWEARDVGTRTIRSETLAALGGVEGALTRHADRLLASLTVRERDAARGILLRLVTAAGTRARRSVAELLAGDADGRAERAALEVLVHGRLVVANDARSGAYELAHEALLSSWSTLQGWLQRGAADRAVRLRVEHAAAEWERMGRSHELLWGRRQLREARGLDREAIAPREAAFLAAGRTAIRTARVVAAGAAALLVVGAVVVGLGLRARARRELEAVIADQMWAGVTSAAEARQHGQQRDAARDRAFGLFDAHRWPEGEDAWTQVEALAVREAGAYRAASSHVEAALSLDPGRASVREQLADLLFERLLRARRDRQGDIADELAARLAAYDDGSHRAELDAAVRIDLQVLPPGTRVWIERDGAARTFVGQAPLAALKLPPGEVVFSLEAPGRVAARLPMLLSHEHTVTASVALPTAGAVPAEMIYVPPGRFLFGSADGSDLRLGFLNAPPVHEVATDGYLIGRHEVTFGEWIEFLDELPPGERRRRSPSSVTTQSRLTLTEIGPKRWRLELTPTTRTYTAETGQRLRYEGRARRAEQDWTRFPVAAISYDDAIAYAAWLDRTGRLAGARLCDEYEWERAARGGDARTFPGGAALAPDDANIDVTYGREPLAYGPDEVGSHPRSRSPVGADDMAGNVWEWTRSVETPGAPVARGGGWYNAALSSRSTNREPGEPTERNVLMGVRLCATPREPPR